MSFNKVSGGFAMRNLQTILRLGKPINADEHKIGWKVRRVDELLIRVIMKFHHRTFNYSTN